MGAAATRERGLGALPQRGRARRGDARRPGSFDRDPGRRTLEQRINTIWSSLVETGTAECPVCDAELVAGRPCGGCGSELT